MDELAVQLVMDREVSRSNPGGVKCFSTRLSFESNSSDISRFMFILDLLVFYAIFALDSFPLEAISFCGWLISLKQGW